MVQGHYTIYSKAVFVKYEANRAKWSVHVLRKKDISVVRYDLDLWPTNVIQGYCRLIDHRHSVRKVWARLDQGERTYVTDKDFIYNSAIILTLDLEILFKVTAHPLTRGTLWVKYEARLGQGERRYASDKQSRTDRQTKGRTDIRTDLSL